MFSIVHVCVSLYMGVEGVANSMWPLPHCAETPTAGGTHPTGTLSCFTLLLILKKQFFTFRVAHMICGG